MTWRYNKKSYGTHMNANFEENTIVLMCPKTRAPSHYVKTCCSFDYHIKYFLIRITNYANKHTQLKHCILWRVPVSNLTDDVTKQKKSYGSHMNANFEENAFQMCYKIRAQSHYGKNTVLLITISNIFWLELQLSLKSIHS